jgi:hypothetical protein
MTIVEAGSDGHGDGTGAALRSHALVAGGPDGAAHAAPGGGARIIALEAGDSRDSRTAEEEGDDDGDGDEGMGGMGGTRTGTRPAVGDGGWSAASVGGGGSGAGGMPSPSRPSPSAMARDRALYTLPRALEAQTAAAPAVRGAEGLVSAPGPVPGTPGGVVRITAGAPLLMPILIPFNRDAGVGGDWRPVMTLLDVLREVRTLLQGEEAGYTTALSAPTPRSPDAASGPHAGGSRLRRGSSSRGHSPAGDRLDGGGAHGAAPGVVRGLGGWGAGAGDGGRLGGDSARTLPAGFHAASATGGGAGGVLAVAAIASPRGATWLSSSSSILDLDDLTDALGGAATAASCEDEGGGGFGVPPLPRMRTAGSSQRWADGGRGGADGGTQVSPAVSAAGTTSVDHELDEELGAAVRVDALDDRSGVNITRATAPFPPPPHMTSRSASDTTIAEEEGEEEVVRLPWGDAAPPSTAGPPGGLPPSRTSALSLPATVAGSLRSASWVDGLDAHGTEQSGGAVAGHGAAARRVVRTGDGWSATSAVPRLMVGLPFEGEGQGARVGGAAAATRPDLFSPGWDRELAALSTFGAASPLAASRLQPVLPRPPAPVPPSPYPPAMFAWSGEPHADAAVTDDDRPAGVRGVAQVHAAAAGAGSSIARPAPVGRQPPSAGGAWAGLRAQQQHAFVFPGSSEGHGGGIGSDEMHM